MINISVICIHFDDQLHYIDTSFVICMHFDVLYYIEKRKELVY